MIVAYVRTARPSKEAQQAQEDEIAAAMGSIDRVYRDTGSGLTTHQGLRDAIDSLAAGDVLAVVAADRLSRSASAYQVVADEVRQRGATLDVVTLSLENQSC
jgi:DNA invertase Pin-like site-specific DNA recombinase